MVLAWAVVESSTNNYSKRQRVSLDPDTLLDVKAGLARLRPAAVAPESVFTSLDTQRRSGRLAASLSRGSLSCQACPKRFGLLEKSRAMAAALPHLCRWCVSALQ
jgi:hypothetical protein